MDDGSVISRYPQNTNINNYNNNNTMDKLQISTHDDESEDVEMKSDDLVV